MSAPTSGRGASLSPLLGESGYLAALNQEFSLVPLMLILALFLVYLARRAANRGGSGRVVGFPGKGRRESTRKFDFRPFSRSDPRAQMEAVQRSEYEVTRLLNREEARILPVLEKFVRDLGQGHRLMAQTSLGEVIRPRRNIESKEWADLAFAAINSKRLDFAIIDRYGRIRVALEYQGSGHYHGTTFMRDAVKREALRKAGVAYVEIANTDRPDDIRARLSTVFRPVSAHAT